MEYKFEKWVPIIGYEGLYEVSNNGYVKSLSNSKTRKEKILNQNLNRDGYCLVFLCKNGKRKAFTVHRLVAIAFIPNSENKCEVNHINGIKNDNRSDNLEWNTRIENLKHRTKTLEYSHSEMTKHKISETRKKKGVLQICSESKTIIAEFSDSYLAERETGINQGNIIQCCKGKRKIAGGYFWKYV
ncbi:MAG: HNH endonuclease [Bacteroidales bacterium]|jgi:hypothetical protein|nr:HNH endonuclease [Bacteroidales bacterium]